MLKNLTITIPRIITLGLILFNVGLVSLAQILLKYGTGKLPKWPGKTQTINFLAKITFSPGIFFGTFLYVLSLTLWIYILTRSKLSVAYPIMSLSYVTVMFLSIIIFRENVNILQWLGAFLIITGTSLIFLFK